jgi:DNA-binding transcriptional ArsR family regulator
VAINSETAEYEPDASRMRAEHGIESRAVIRIRCTAGDLTRIRFSSGPYPLLESVLGLAELSRPSCGRTGGRWRSQVRLAFPRTARPLLELVPPSGRWPDFLDLLVTDPGQGLEMVRATPRRVLREQVPGCRPGERPSSWLRALAEGDAEALGIALRGLRDFHSACVAPYWPGVTTTVHADTAERVSVMSARGLDGVFGTLHEDLTWRAGSFEKAARISAEFQLDGQGLELVPSAVWKGPPLFVLRPPERGGSALIYPARDAGTFHGSHETRDITGVLGQTRAQALRALATPCGTAELASRLGISAPAASEQARALRTASLIYTVRSGRGVRHSLTALGRGLLNGH